MHCHQAKTQDGYRWQKLTDEQDAELSTIKGRCSGIPECCIRFWNSKWRRGKLTARQRQRIFNRLWALDIHWGYIPCPKHMKWLEEGKFKLTVKRCKVLTGDPHRCKCEEDYDWPEPS